ncbi:TonB-dependent receptor domain-containing protein [Qipengyuania aquimaris]|uniref:TonB-dependent receptor domain-containing protein n=1 Tax=Qipengyuania aquimaris TaxID=255984 RepID=UPI001CD68F1E|nr:TonB-dependent receptor [Qipengyuania aquimaris]MCA0903028.1 TonB-dependent receptor [Qipengyuania aquimaris]
MRNRLNATIGRTALCVGLLACPGVAFAQAEAEQAGAEEPATNTIVVTGSLIRGTPEDAALPVDVFTADDLRKQGVDSPLEFIKDLPSVGAVLGDSNQFSTDAQGFQGVGSINLRGLGATRTLVLMNGKRTILTPGAGFVDTQLIPLFALERVEILKDGAGSTYGSDAIAGVANFITRSRFTGVELQGDYNFVDGSDGNYSMSALAGFELGDANLVVGAGWQHRSELATTARDYINVGYATNPSAYSALSTPGLVAVSYFDTATGNVDTQVRPDRGCNDLGGFQDGALCRFTYVPFDNLVEDEDRYQVFAQFTAQLSDTVTFQTDALWAKSDLESLNYSPAFPPTQGPNGSGFQSAFTTSPSNPGVSAFLDQVGLPQSSPTNPIVRVTNVLFRPFGYLGNPLDPDRGAGTGGAKNEAWRITGGFDFELGNDLVFEIDGTFWESKREAFAPGIIGSRLQAALNGFGGANCTGTTPGANGCVYFNPFVNAGPGNPTLDISNPFYVPGAENSEDLVRWLQVRNGTVEEEIQVVFDAVLSGPTGVELGGGPLAFAVGAQYRKNDYRTDPINDESNLDINPCFIEGDQSCVGTTTEGVGPFIFLGGFRPARLSQDVYALFAEVNAPVTDRLELAGAIRFEDYGSPIGSTINPKGSIRFEATDWLTLRGSLGTTFRGPLAVNVAPNSVTQLQGFTAAGGNYKSLDVFGNPTDLGPETALTYNAGVIFNVPLGAANMTFSADYWAINLKDRITTTPGDAIASLVANGQTTGNDPVDCSSPLAGLITFSNNVCVQGTTTGLDISRVRTDFVNGPDVDISGLDFALNVDVPFGEAMFSFGGNAVYNLGYEFDDFEVQGIVVQESYDAVGFGNYFRDPNTVPEWRANGYANLNWDMLNVRYSVTHIDGVFDDRCINRDPCFQTSQGPTDFGIESGSYTQHDIAVTLQLDLAGAEVELQGAIENFTDAEPAEAQLPLGYNPFIGNAIGRNYRIGLRTRF